jgi:hypothetical protein
MADRSAIEFAEGRGREATLEFYRSMDFEKLAP